MENNMEQKSYTYLLLKVESNAEMDNLVTTIKKTLTEVEQATSTLDSFNMISIVERREVLQSVEALFGNPKILL